MPVKKIAILASFVGVAGLYAEDRANLFHIKRNKNRNEVHYAVRYDKATCKPLESDPLFGYWLMIEKGPGVTEPIGRFEQMAYGIKSQELQGEVLTVQLKAFPDRPVRISFTHKSPCNVTATININGQEAQLKTISVFAEEGLIKPTVKYIDISGVKGGAAVTERINR